MKLEEVQRSPLIVSPPSHSLSRCRNRSQLPIRTVIVYRLGANDTEAVGKHWISYSGQLTPYAKEKAFDQGSIGYKVLMQTLPSPYFTIKEIAEKQGQNRPEDASYRPFITFRLNDNAIMALDWPEELRKVMATFSSRRIYSMLILRQPLLRYSTIGRGRCQMPPTSASYLLCPPSPRLPLHLRPYSHLCLP